MNPLVISIKKNNEKWVDIPSDFKSISKNHIEWMNKDFFGEIRIKLRQIWILGKNVDVVYLNNLMFFVNAKELFYNLTYKLIFYHTNFYI